jgi:multidrug efflux pump
VGLTVLSISLSLVAVFVPILLLGGILGRMLREFTVTLSIETVISLVISLTTTPMLCSLLLRSRLADETPCRSAFFVQVLAGYERTLGWALRHRLPILLIFFCAIGLNVALFAIVPKGFFPKQDTGRLFGLLQADQSISFQAMAEKLREMMAIVQQDPAVQNVVGFTGAGSGFGGSSNAASLLVALRPISQRPSIDQVIARLSAKLAEVPGGHLYLGAVQDIQLNGRQSASRYQYTLQSDSSELLSTWTPKLIAALEHSSVLADVTSDLQQKGLQTNLFIDRDTAARLGITPAQIDNTLYDAFGQRQVSVIYGAINQYHVVMELDRRYTENPASLSDIYVSTSGVGPSGTATANLPAGTVVATAGSTSSARWISATSAGDTAGANADNNSARNAAINAFANAGKSNTSFGAAVSTSRETMILLAALSQRQTSNTSLAVNHQGLFVASTISFDLQPGAALGQAVAEINGAMNQIRTPASIHGDFAGTAQVFQQSLHNEPILIAAAIAAVYILLGVLYESYIHPITILSTLPSAGIGALLALILLRTEFDIIGFIGVILLVGIAEKNAIMMIDFAIEAQRSQHSSAYDAIYQACLLRFRPIMMTTTAALLGAIPLVVGFGNGSELRRPLGISIIGGLFVSQLLTLYTTPVLYLFFDQFGGRSVRRRRRLMPSQFRSPSAS